MVRVIEEEAYPKNRVVCVKCNRLLEYDKYDLEENFYVKESDDNRHFITCPVCKTRIFITKDESV